MNHTPPPSRQKTLSEPDHPTPPTPSPGPYFRPLYSPIPAPLIPPSTLPPRLRARRLHLSDHAWGRLRELQRGVARKGLVAGGKRGRPPIADATIEMLLDEHMTMVRERLMVRAGLRARRRDVRVVDRSARRGLMALFNAKGLDATLRYRPIDVVMRDAYPQHRPPQRHIDTIRFCQEGLLVPAYHLPDGTVVESEPMPWLVPTYVYSRGPSLGVDT